MDKYEQQAEAFEALDAWRKANPEAAQALQELWKTHLTVGHKFMGRVVTGRSLESIQGE
jgi:ferric-dicitrate binding protein FerR (iron transport regulator)